MNNLELSILLKQLRDISCQQIINHIFIHPLNIKILLQIINLINYGQSGGIDKDSLIFLYQIILNLSADISTLSPDNNIPASSLNHPLSPNHSLIALEDLQIPICLQSSNTKLIKIAFQIISNYLIGDPSSKTIYFLITKIKIFPILLKIMIERRNLLNNQTEIEQENPNNMDNMGFLSTFMWFCNKVLSTTLKFNSQNLHPDYRNFVMHVIQQVMCHFQKHLNSNQSQNKTQILPIHQIFNLFKSLLKTQLFSITQQFIQQTYKLFNPKSKEYLQYLIALTCITQHSIENQKMLALLIQLLENPNSRNSQKIIKIINNSLLNNSNNWKTVIDIFIKYSKINENQKIIDTTFGFVTYFIYFLKNKNTQYDISKLIKIIICAQEGLGIFEQAIPELVKSKEMEKQLNDIEIHIQAY